MEDPLKEMAENKGEQPQSAEIEKEPQRTPIKLPTEGYSLEVELWDESAVRRVAEGVIRLRPGGLENGEVLYEFSGGANGLADLHGIESGQYKLEVEASGFFPPKPIYLEIPFAKKRLRVEMEAALLLFGNISDGKGKTRNDGVIRISNRHSGSVTHCPVDNEGRFSSIALPGGVYSLVWVPEERAPARVGSGLEAAGAPGDRLEFEITVE